jgi:hypothetical protein
MTRDQLAVVLQNEIKVLSTDLTSSDYNSAITKASMETGFALPNTNDTESYWLLERAKRHCLFSLWIARADKFQVKQIKLNQKFDNVGKLIESMDKAWSVAQNDIALLLGDSYKVFGTLISSGFAYDPLTGQDISYDTNQEVIITPSSNDS